jgi:hypothetical protein
MDYELGVWVLCNHAEVAKRKISAETSTLAAGQQQSPRLDEPGNREGGAREADRAERGIDSGGIDSA